MPHGRVGWVPPPATSWARQTLPRPEGQGPGQAPAGPTQEPFVTRGRPLRSGPVLMSGCSHVCQGLWVGTVQPWARVGTGTGPELPREPARPACCPRPQSAHYGGASAQRQGDGQPCVWAGEPQAGGTLPPWWERAAMANPVGRKPGTRGVPQAGTGHGGTRWEGPGRGRRGASPQLTR